MHFRQWMLACVTTALAVSGATAPAALAAGEPAEPLNQYVVSGKISGDTLARQGYDLSEASLPGNKKGFSIVATPAQAQSLRDKGATVVAPFGTARALRAAPSSPLQQPTHGYDVFRPWSLKPAPCPTTCSTPLVPLKTWYDDLRQAQPRHRPEGRLRQVRARPGPRRLPDHRRRPRAPPRAGPAVIYDADAARA